MPFVTSFPKFVRKKLVNRTQVTRCTKSLLLSRSICISMVLSGILYIVPEFIQVCTVLDNVMQERTESNIGVGTKRAKLITYDIEQDLWDCGFLGHDTPDKLRTTTYYVIGMGFFLRAVQEHYGLRRDVTGKKSQITFERNSRGSAVQFIVRMLVLRHIRVASMIYIRSVRKSGSTPMFKIPIVVQSWS